MLIIPSILVQTEAKFREQIRALIGLTPSIQIDIADGDFVPSTTWANPVMAKETLGELEAELHLMVRRPLETAREWQKVPQIKTALVHYESMSDLRQTLSELADYGWKVGLVLNPETPLEAAEPYLSDIHIIQIMGVHPGFQGTAFIPKTLERVKQAKLKYPDKFIQVDGGVNESTLPDLVRARADAVTPGSAIFGNERSPAENLTRLKSIIQKVARQIDSQA